MAWAAELVQSMAPMGIPLAMGLARVVTSGEDAVVLVGEPFSCATHAALDLVGEEKGAGRVAQGSGFPEKFLRKRVDAAFALDGLEADGADFVGEFGAEV